MGFPNLKDPEVLADIFKHHPPVDEAAVARHQKIRDAARIFAQVIVDNTPACGDQTTAVRHVRDAMMTANAAIALNGRC